jgi:LmbE family N-acetylglucosaminyl deacetylase
MTNFEQKTNSKRILLAVLAHPDDETFGIGGTLAKYAHEDTDVYLICATKGEVGEMDEQFMQGFSDPADRRECELRCAAKKLGIKEVIFLNYRDSGMPGSVHNQNPLSLWATPVEEIAAKIVAEIKKIEPQVIITFDPIGGYHHPDHIRIHEATKLAFQYFYDDSQALQVNQGSVYRPQKLYYQTIPRGFLKVTVRLLRFFGKDPKKYGKNQDIDLQAIAEVNFPIHAEINYFKYAGLRGEASACHSSQGGSKLGGGILGWLRALFGSKELFMRAYPQPKVDEHKELDLFAGI